MPTFSTLSTLRDRPTRSLARSNLETQVSSQIRRANVTWDSATLSWPPSFTNVAPNAVAALDDVWLLCHYAVT